MKYFIVALVLAVSLLFIVPVHAAAPPAGQTECDGSEDLTVMSGAAIGMCWKKNPPQDAVTEYIVTGKEQGTDTPIWEISVLPSYCNEYICETDPLTVTQQGLFEFTVKASDGTYMSGESNVAKLTVTKAVATPTDLKVKSIESQ